MPSMGVTNVVMVVFLAHVFLFISEDGNSEEFLAGGGHLEMRSQKVYNFSGYGKVVRSESIPYNCRGKVEEESKYRLTIRN
jgi:hypothetical protein